AERHNLIPDKIIIRRQKTRWGSCSVNRTLSFNFKLLMLRADIIDYVIVHELCHLNELNHSSNYWSLVGEILPGYKLLRKELKQSSI
ncbi:MAG TPA: M48 family metallopeptidase, partial [Ignavibacteriaceae bacterium]|nr:M48 family metallopeptidase [Ignavibacteriaceae bacterium]